MLVNLDASNTVHTYMPYRDMGRVVVPKCRPVTKPLRSRNHCGAAQFAKFAAKFPAEERDPGIVTLFSVLLGDTREDPFFYQ